MRDILLQYLELAPHFSSSVATAFSFLDDGVGNVTLLEALGDHSRASAWGSSAG